MSYSNWGYLDTLNIDDLKDDQLDKLSFMKLVEFLPNNKVESILVERMRDKLFTREDINYIKIALGYDTKLISKIKLLAEELNEYFYSKRLEQDSWVENICSKELALKFMNQKNYYNELIRSIKFDDRNSLVPLYNLTNDHLKTLYNEEIKNYWQEYVYKKIEHNTLNYYELIKFLEFIDEAQFKDLREKLIKLERKTYFYQLLAYPLLGDSDIHDILKATRKTSQNGVLNIVVKESILSKYATVTRLEVVEKIMFHSHYDKFPFEKDLTPDKMGQLLFGSSIRYNNRFTQVINRYQTKYNYYYQGELNGTESQQS